MSRISIAAPAKLNLFLHVLGRRRDGYHDLQTVFQLLDLADRIELRGRVDGRIRRPRGPPGIAADADLSVRAAHLLKSASGTSAGCDIFVEKRIPFGAGLGGGSSNAAAVLVGLNGLWALGLGRDKLEHLGLELGADVPVFVRGRTAWGEGVGERLRPVTVDSRWYLILTPKCEISTAAVFSNPALTRNSPALTIDRFTCGQMGDPAPKLEFAALWRATRNDCEPLVRAMYAPVDAAMTWLERFAEARLTGTGASVFAPFASTEAAMQVQNRAPDEFRAVVARGLNHIPRPGDG